MYHLSACTAVGILLATPPALQAQEKQASAPAATASKPAAPAKDAAAAPICFKVSGVCIERKTSTDGAATDPKPLDLEVRREDMAWVLEELNLPAGDEESVEIRTRTLPSAQPSIPGGPFALFWALRHPAQAWRIFAPAPTR